MSFSMLRLLPVSLLFSSCAFSVNAANNDTQLQPLATSALVLDMANKGSTAVAVGERGHLFVFHQGWQQKPSPTKALLTKVSLFNEQLGWAVGHDSTILHTQDAGESWQTQMSSAEMEKPLMDVLFFDQQQGIAIGAYGLFYRTLNGGQSWQQEFHGELLYEEDIAYLEELKAEDEQLYLSERSMLLPHFNRVVQLNEQRLLMVGELGLAAMSEDLGKTWQRIEFPYDGSLFNILVAKQGIYVMGLRGHLFKSEGDLDDWQTIELPIESSLNGGLVLDDERIRLVGNAGVVIDVYADDSVKMVEQRQGENLVAINQTSDGKQWLVGSKGFIELNQQQKLKQDQ
ncbi:YCF48-related protein [Shewanella sp. Isolate11]|uniref:WD40/YVTN/BNR-like repeat-containing protein n=1 Tax=Shewanella sp. Isolate11 TaxID=2908530 RepID=UPI001EFE8D50|nr:YCF48-related protein [Shewanella sp. Isolate11]MCG9696500.1 YCF48-related protein [Shewanella sp. Isolate11]